MKRGSTTGQELQRQYYELSQFLGGYLHQDWAHDYDSWERAVDHAVSESTHDDIHVVLEQLDQVLALKLPASDLGTVLMQLGCYYWPGRDEAYDPWLRAVATRISATSSTNAI